MLRLSIKMTKGVTMSRKIMLTLCLLVSSFIVLSAVTLDGVVIGGAEGAPIAGALLELHHGNMETFETTTDESGFFAFTDLETGNYMLHVEANDFLPFMQMVELNEDMTITIELLPEGNPGELTGHLYGIVTYEDGAAAAGLEMMIGTYNPNAQPHHVVYDTVTGEDGSYNFAEIVDFAVYEVVVMIPMMPFQTEVYVEGETEFNFVLEEYIPGETYSLSGTVTDAETGEAISGIGVVLHGMQGMMQEALTDEAGYYIFAEVLEGTYNLTIPGHNSGYQQFMTEIEIVENTEFDIALLPVEQGELSLSGVVTDAETGDVLPGIIINVHAGQGMHYEAVSGEDGNYLMEGLFAGEYNLTAVSEDLNYMHFQAELEIQEDTIFDIQMQAYVAGELTLSGTITEEESGDPLAGLVVHLWGENVPGGMLMGFSDETGYYEIMGIFPGEYELNVMGMQGIVLYTAEVEILENMSYDIVIGENPGDTGSLSGQVIDLETNEFISGVEIYIQRNWETYETVSGEEGYFIFEEVPVGHYHVIAGMEGYEQFNEIVEIDGDVFLEIILEPIPVGDYVLSGTVTDAETGDVIPEVHVQLMGEQGHHNFAETNEDGYYEFTGLFEGTYQLMAFTNGWNLYEPYNITIDIYDNIVFDFELIPIELPGSGSVSGMVYDAESGDVIAGAFLHLASIGGGNPGGGWWNHYEVNSDETGLYVISNVEEGEYILTGEAEGYLMSFYDGASNPEEATVIEISEDEEVVADMTLIPLVFYTVSGTVMNFVNNVPIAEAVVRAMIPGTGCNHWAVAESITDELGNYILEVPQGDYIFVAEYGSPNSQDFMRQYYDHKQTPASADVVTISEDISGIDFDLALPENYDNHISGTITVEGGIPENPVLVAAVSGGGNHWEAACVTDMFGNYILNNLPEGDYYILAYEFASVPTYYPGVIDFQDAEFVSAIGYVTGIDFELILPESNGVYQVDGYVYDHNNQPVANANVVILDEAEVVLSYAVTNSEGYYLVNGLPSGNLTGLATKVLYQSDTEAINVTTTGTADFVIIPEATTGAPEDQVTPAAVTLSNYPNPFNPETTISFGLTEAGYTTLNIYNIAGQKIATLVQDELSAGTHSITWDGTTSNGANVASGMYFYRLQSGDYSITNKMVLMK